MGILESSRSSAVVFGRRMARLVFAALVVGLLGLYEPVVCQSGGSAVTSPGATEVTSPGGGGLNLPIPIPTSLRFYEGSDTTIDSCPRDEVVINDTCHRLLTQGPCQPSDFVLLDPNTYEGYCAARLCAPDRIFVFSDQLCHDPFSSDHCPGAQELFQTAFGTPICQCPDGFLEAEMGSCVAPLTPTITCPAGQVLWTNDSRSMQVCGPDPCGRLNLDRPLPSPPFVPSLADGTCYQLGQVSGVCPRGTFYSLDLEVRRGVCAMLEDAGYVILDAARQLLYQDLYGPFTLLDHTLLTPTMSQPALPPTQAPAELLAGSAGTLVGHTAGLTQQPGQLGDRGHAQTAGGAGQRGGVGASSQGGSQGGSVATDITFGNIPVSGSRGHEAFYGGYYSAGHQAAGRPSKRLHHRNHYIRGHNLGPTRYYKFDSLNKHFMPTRLDLSRLYATRGQNHLVRPFPAKSHRGATAPIKVEVVPARLLAQAIFTGNQRYPDFTRQHSFPSETREADDDHESQEHQDSVAESQPQEEKGAHADEAETSAARRRRAAQSVGVVETRLVTCRTGARTHVNAKCRHTLLPFFSLPPSALQPTTDVVPEGVKTRSVRSAAPLTPTMSCPQGTSFGLHRQCDINNSVTASFSVQDLQ